MRNFIYIFFVCLAGWATAQQRPFINSIDKTSATVGETITISGSGFSGNMQVNFGAGVATITNSTSTLLEVTVPVTATYGPVTALDLNTGLAGISSQAFMPSFSGGTFDETAVDAQIDFPTNQQFTYDVCACDFDGDGKIDMGVANGTGTSVSVFRNTSTVTTTSFARTNIANSFETFSAECGDLNGDGKPDLIFNTRLGTNANHVFVYRNTSSGAGNISFVKTEFKLPNLGADVRNPHISKIRDIDSDGTADIIVSNRSDNTLHIYRNTSTQSGAISFEPPVEISVTGSSGTGTFEVGDLNGDGLADIVALAFQTPGSNIFVLKNISSPGTIDFTNESIIQNGGDRITILIADLNADNQSEVITTSITNDDIDIFQNTSSGGAITFNSSPITLTNITNPWGLEAADLNGDGLTDLGVVSAQGAIHIYESTGTGFTFNNKSISTTEQLLNIAIADFNGDAKPDFGLTHDNATSTTFGDATVIINRNCIIPSIGPTDLTFCTGNPFTLNATKTIQAIYTWAIVTGDASITPSGDQASVTVNTGTSVQVRVTINSNDGDCSEQTTETFTLTGGSPPPAPTIANSNTGTICAGTSFTLSGPTGRDQYFWTFPDGTETTTTTNSISITNASSADAGIYKLRVQSTGGCVSNEGTRTVTIDEPPVVEIVNTGADDFCETASVVLEVPDYTGFSFQWKRGGTNLTGETGNTFTANQSGDYTVGIISDASGCERVSNVYTLNAVSVPSASFSSDSEICVNAALVFDASASTGDAGFGLTYNWDFGDGNTGTGQTPSHTYTTSGSYNAVLSVGYSNVASCVGTFSNTITVSDIPNISISVPDGTTEKCPADSILLELPQTYVSYNWSTGDTDYFTYAKTASGESEVTVSVDAVTEIGCPVNDEITVTNFANAGISITATDAQIINDTVTLESGVSSLTLTASNGSNYMWTPAGILDTNTGPTVEVFPQDLESVVTVSGTDSEGCATSTSITIITPGVIPRKSFSPNGDMMGYDCWEILNTENLEGCEVFIFDQRGSYVFKGNSPFANNCVWNGNIDNGSTEAPEGIYYFILKCENSRFNKTGTILLGR